MTHHRRPVARPALKIAGCPPGREFEVVWAEMDQLAAEIGREWPKGISAAQAVSEDRRELGGS